MNNIKKLFFYGGLAVLVVLLVFIADYKDKKCIESGGQLLEQHGEIWNKCLHAPKVVRQ